jgi:hypothetical protein
VIGYYVHMGTESRDYTTNWFVDGRLNTNSIVRGLTPGVYYFAATAVSSNMQSEYSNEARAPIPHPPARLIVTNEPAVNIHAMLQVSDSITGPWEKATRYPVQQWPVSDGVRFFRVELEATR